MRFLVAARSPMMSGCIEFMGDLGLGSKTEAPSGSAPAGPATPEHLPEQLVPAGGSYLEDIAAAEGTLSRNGINYDDTYGHGKYAQPPKPLTQMTLAEVEQFGNVLGKATGSLNTSAVGGFQIQAQNHTCQKRQRHSVTIPTPRNLPRRCSAGWRHGLPSIRACQLGKGLRRTRTCAPRPRVIWRRAVPPSHQLRLRRPALPRLRLRR